MFGSISFGGASFFGCIVTRHGNVARCGGADGNFDLRWLDSDGWLCMMGLRT